MLTCERESARGRRGRAGGGQYATGLSSTMHLSHNSVRHNTLLSVCTVKASNKMDQMEHNVWFITISQIIL
jgi:hypothetical protein